MSASSFAVPAVSARRVRRAHAAGSLSAAAAVTGARVSVTAMAAWPLGAGVMEGVGVADLVAHAEGVGREEGEAVGDAEAQALAVSVPHAV
jgi:hypothetical protein